MERARGGDPRAHDLAPADGARPARRRGAAACRWTTSRIGDVVIVRPGEKIPVDGVVVAGERHVNQAPVTGESLPVEKRPGDEVFAGTINGRGALDDRASRACARDRTLARIIHLVERAQAQRAPGQTFVDRFARVYTPAVVVLAVAGRGRAAARWRGGWTAERRGSIARWCCSSIACPCALVISTPVSIVSALAAAARKGVLSRAARTSSGWPPSAASRSTRPAR